MERLTLADMYGLSEFLRDAYALRDLNGFVGFVVSRLPILIESDVTYYDEVNTRRSRTVYVQHPIDIGKFPGSDEALNAHILEHPFSVHYRRVPRNRAHRISDWLAQRQWHRLPVYNEFFRRIGIEHQMAVFLPAPADLLVAITVSRGLHDFSDRDRLIMNLLGPHLAQAYRNAEAITLLRQAGPTSRHGTVLLSPQGCIENNDGRAETLLAEYFATRAGSGDRLPESLRRWLAEQEARLARSNDAPRPAEPLIVEREHRRLTVRFFSGPTQRLLLLEEERNSSDARPFEALGLTRRQAEVLAWVTQGKTNDEIATILGLSRRTVAKHLEFIYPKLGVETRTAAALQALTSISQSSVN